MTPGSTDRCSNHLSYAHRAANSILGKRPLGVNADPLRYGKSMRRVLLLIVALAPVLAQSTPLTTAAREGLLTLLIAPGGAYQSYALYAKALSILGPSEPYRHFLDGERAKIEQVKQRLRDYGVTYPEKNPYLGTLSLPKNPDALARMALSLETKSTYLEKRLGRVFQDYEDLYRFVKTLEAADQTQAKILKMAIAQGGTLGIDVVRGLAKERQGDPVCVFVFGKGLCP